MSCLSLKKSCFMETTIIFLLQRLCYKFYMAGILHLFFYIFKFHCKVFALKKCSL